MTIMIPAVINLMILSGRTNLLTCINEVQIVYNMIFLVPTDVDITIFLQSSHAHKFLNATRAAEIHGFMVLLHEKVNPIKLKWMPIYSYI